MPAAAVLILPPMVLGRRNRMGGGKLPIVVYFGCLGLGYIMLEVGINSWFSRALTNPTIAASGMQVFSGPGSWVAEKINHAGRILPLLMATIALSLVAMALALPAVLAAIGALSYPRPARRAGGCGGGLRSGLRPGHAGVPCDDAGAL